MTFQIDTNTAIRYYNSQDYRDDLSALVATPALAAKMTVALLVNIALDPTCGTRVEDFLLPGKPGDEVLVNMPIHRTANFIGLFGLVVGSPEYKMVGTAVEANLAGPMFRAAQIERRLERRYSDRVSRWEGIAYRASTAAADAANLACPRTHRNRTQADIWAIQDAITNARVAAFQPLKDRYMRRVKKLAQLKDRTDLMAGSFYAVAGTFVKHFASLLSAQDQRNLEPEFLA